MFPFQQPQNPIFSMFGSMQNFNNQFNNFKQNFSQQGFGNPQALVQNMLNSGQMPHMTYDGNRTYRVEGSYENQNGGMSNARGRSRTTGRYVSRDSAYDIGRSNHSIKDRMVDSLERMYDEAATEHERNVVDKWIREIESSER